MNDSGIITPSGEKISLALYEIGPYLNKIVNKYIEENDENKELYELFKQEYKTFSPNLDFCLCILGYKMYNPFLFDDRVIEGSGNNIRDINNTNICYMRCTDKNLKIDKVSYDNLKEGIISPEGIKFEINREEKFHHEQLFETILLQKMINDKNIFDDYVYSIKNNLFPTLNSYFRNKLGFLQVVIYPNKEGFILYNEKIVSNCMSDLLKSIKALNPNIKIEDESKYCNEGGIYESRRI